MKPEILQLVPVSKSVQQELDTLYTTHASFDGFPYDHTPENIEVLLTNGAIGASSQMIDALPHLKLITVHGIGLDAIDLEKAKQKNIRVSIARDSSTDDVADIAIGLLLDITRQISAQDRHIRAGYWVTKGRYPRQGTSLTHKNVGIMGMGPIGKTIARRLMAFDMKISYTARHCHHEVAWEFIPSLVDLAQNSDFLIIAASGGRSSYHAVNQEVLEALGERGFLVNIGRGSIIDEMTLVQFLKAGKIAGAGLDVFTDEPYVPPDLFQLDNVVMTTHSASSTYETTLRSSKMVIQSIKDFYAGKDLPFSVT